MGVINLSVLVDKIKRKLLKSGFITSSDKASKSKFGIVKIGDNLNVNSGVVSVPVATESTYGVVKATSAGGMDTKIIYNKAGTGSSESIVLDVNFTDYKFIQYTRVKSGTVFNGAVAYIPTSLAANDDFNLDCNGSYTVHVYFTDATHIAVEAPTSSSGDTILTLIK